MTRVSVHFDNSDRKIPVDSDSITITREMDDKGERNPADHAPMNVGANGVPSIRSLALAVEMMRPCLFIGRRPSE